MGVDFCGPFDMVGCMTKQELRLYKEDTIDGQLKLIYEWVKTGVINLMEFSRLVDIITCGQVKALRGVKQQKD